jgi:hypothetical protein
MNEESDMDINKIDDLIFTLGLVVRGDINILKTLLHDIERIYNVQVVYQRISTDGLLIVKKKE